MRITSDCWMTRIRWGYDVIVDNTLCKHSRRMMYAKLRQIITGVVMMIFYCAIEPQIIILNQFQRKKMRFRHHLNTEHKLLVPTDIVGETVLDQNGSDQIECKQSYLVNNVKTVKTKTQPRNSQQCYFKRQNESPSCCDIGILIQCRHFRIIFCNFM